MSIRAVCPECGATTTLDDASGNKTVACRQCGSEIAVPGVKAGGPPPLPPKPASAAAPEEEPAFEVLEDEEMPSPPKPIRNDADDDEPMEPNDIELSDDESGDGDDDEEESIPRRRPGDPPSRSAGSKASRGGEVSRRGASSREPAGRPAAATSKMILLLVGLFCFALVAAGGGAATYITWPNKEDKSVASVSRPNDTNPIPPRKKDSIVPQSVPKVSPPKPIDVPDLLPITPVAFEGDKKVIPLPERMADLCAAGDGRFILMHGSTQAKLYVFDVNDLRIAKEIETTGKDARWSAGATKLLLADNATRTFKRYDLATMQIDKEGPYPFPGTIDDLAIGSGSQGPAMVVTTEPGENWPVRFVDLETLGLSAVAWKETPPVGLPRSLTLNAAANGSRWVGIPPGKDAKGGVVVSREGNVLTLQTLPPDSSLGYAALSADGSVLYSRQAPVSANGVNALPNGNVLKDRASVAIPSVSGNLTVYIIQTKGKNGLALKASLAATGLGYASSSTPRFDIGEPYAVGDSLPPDRHLFYAPQSKVMVTYPSAGEPRMEVYKVDPVQGYPVGSIQITSTLPVDCKSGIWFTHRIKHVGAESVTYRIQNLEGAQSATIDETGAIRCLVPDSPRPSRLKFIVTVMVRNEATTRTYDLHNLAIPAPKTVDPPQVVIVPKPKDPKETMPKDPKPPIIAGNIAVGVKLVQEAAGKLPIKPAAMATASIDVALPGPIRDACVGGGGRYLIFHCPSARQLAIFDVNTLNVEKTIGLNTDEVLFAAGMEKLLVIYPDEKVVMRYSLATFKREADIDLDVRQKATSAAMGSGTAGPLILGGIPAQNNASKMALTFLDPETMKEVLIEKAEGDFKVTTAAAANLRVSADGRTIGAWFMKLEPSWMQLARLSGNTMTGLAKAESLGHIAPGPDGQTVFTANGRFDNKGVAIGPRVSVVPSVQGEGMVAIMGKDGAAQDVVVWLKDQQLATFNDLPGFDGKRDPFERDNPNLALDRRLFCVPDAKILVVIPPAAAKLHIRRVEEKK